MNLGKLNEWLTLAANLGVIAGIVFLAVELRQNSEMVRAQTRTQLAEEVTQLLSANMNDAAYAAVLARGNAGEDLSPVEQYQYARHRSAWIWYWNNVVYQYERGLYDEEEFDVQIELIRADIERYPGLKTHWCVNRGEQASPGLIEAVEVSSTSAYC